MATTAEKVAGFRAAHRPGQPLLLANVWDIGSARFLAGLGFQALATTSSGFAATLGRRDYRVTRDEALAHASALVGATDVPVSADLENCFADDPSGAADTITKAAEIGLAGCSIEDFTGDSSGPIYDIDLATERVAAAAEAAHRGHDFVLTARAENHLHGINDLADTITRLQRYQAAGADVLYAPGLVTIDDIRSVVTSLDKPVNVLTVPGIPPIADLAAAGVARVSVGGAFAFVALGAVARAGRELLDQGTYGWLEGAGDARRVVASARSRSDVREVTTALRVRAYGVGAVMVVLVAWPFTWAARHVQLPAVELPDVLVSRQRVEALSSVVVQMPSGEIKRLSSQLISGGSETTLASVTVINAINSGDGGTDELCQEVAQRLEGDEDLAGGEVLVVTERWDVVDYLQGGRTPEERTVHARCAVPS